MRFATWCATILDPARPIVLIAEPGAEQLSGTRGIAASEAAALATTGQSGYTFSEPA